MISGGDEDQPEELLKRLSKYTPTFNLRYRVVSIYHTKTLHLTFKETTMYPYSTVPFFQRVCSVTCEKELCVTICFVL